MLKESLTKFFKVDTLLGNLTGYLETRVELFKIEVKEDLAKNLSQAIFYFVMVFLIALFIVFFSTAGALLISSRLGGFAGFSIVGGFYLLVGLILFLSRKKVIPKVERRFAIMFRKKK